MKILRSIKGDVGVVSVAGAQRTGKSFILNMLLDKLGGKGFKVSPSTQSCTQGIWIWGSPTEVPSRNMNVILLDTEGSGSIDKNATHDGKIFALVVLISSFFIYNSFGAIDENAINNLSLAAKLSTNIAVRAGKGVSEDEVIANFTPKFLWLLRDFVLEMKEDGHNITENEYLESKINNYTEVKTALVKFFKMRELMTLVRPSENEVQLANLNKVKFQDLRSKFKQKADILRHKVFQECPLKQMNNKRISGKVLAKLLEMYVEAINDGAVPNITSAWESVVDHEREKYFNKAKVQYIHDIKKIEMPLDEAEHLSKLFKLRNQAFETLNYGFKLGDEVSDKQEQSIKLKELHMFIDQTEKDAKKSNLIISRKTCEDVVRNCFSNITLRLRNEGYTPKNMNELEFDVEAFTNAYDKKAVGPAKMEVFIEFMKVAIPKISKDVLSKEYAKQKENEDRLNEAVKILKEKNKMLEDNLKEIEQEYGMKRDEIDEYESKLRKATHQEEMLLQKAEAEAEKRRELMEALESEKERNEKLEKKRKKAEKDLEARAGELEREERDLRRKQALDANLSNDEANRIKEASRQGGRAPRTGEGVNLDDIDVEEKSDQGSTARHNTDTKESKKNKKKKQIGHIEKGKGGCKCTIF